MALDVKLLKCTGNNGNNGSNDDNGYKGENSNDGNNEEVQGLCTKGLRTLQPPQLLLDSSSYLEVHYTYNLLSNCSYNPSISRVTVVMELVFRL